MKITLAEGQRMVKGFPEAFTNKHVAILGTTGAGKTSVAKVAIVEPLLIAKRRVHIIDPKTDWWGLRLMADGKRKAANIYIFGGERGDYPLRVADVPAITEAFARSSDSAIFDTKGMSLEDRSQFFIKYAETILRKNKGPLNIIIDEAHLFMPQAGAKIAGLAPRMLHAGNEMLGSGRSQGLRVAMLTQRPQKLHKDSLTLAKSLIAMQMFHPLDRDSIAAWMKEQADPETGKEVMGSLSSLKPGEAWCWSPVDHYLQRHQFPLPLTFDSSKEPEEGDADVPTLEPINIQDLTGKLGKIEEERKANDPKLLHARIRELEQKSKFLPKVEPMVDRKAVQKAYIEGWHEGHASGVIVAVNTAIDIFKKIEDQARHAELSFETIRDNPGKLDNGEPSLEYKGLILERPVSPTGPQARRTNMGARPAPAKSSGPLPVASGNGSLSRPQQKIVESLEIWHALGHNAPSREQVAALANYSPNSGGFNNLIGGMRTAGIIEIPEPGKVALVDPAGSGIDPGDAGEKMLASLSNPQRELVEAMPKDFATPISRESLAEATRRSPNSGGFNNLIGSLNTLGIFRRPSPGQVALSEWAAEILR